MKDRKIIARCCMCNGPVYSDGTADCDDKLHEIDIDEEREKFIISTGVTPEEYLKDHNQDNSTCKTLGTYHLAIFLRRDTE